MGHKSHYFRPTIYLGRPAGPSDDDDDDDDGGGDDDDNDAVSCESGY